MRASVDYSPTEIIADVSPTNEVSTSLSSLDSANMQYMSRAGDSLAWNGYEHL